MPFGAVVDVSVFAHYSDDPKSNTTEVYSLKNVWKAREQK